MDSLTVTNTNLPADVDELAKFVLIGRDRLTAVRAAIRAIDKVGVAAEVYQQKLTEGQEIAEAVLDAEVRLGELRKAVPRDKGGRPEKTQPDDRPSFVTPVQQFDAAVGFGKSTMKDIECIANHPDIVEQVKVEKREAGEIVTRSDVLKAIEADKKPHVAFNSGNNEWYTPADIIEAAREVMGTIDLDPASSDIANEVVKAGTYYTAENNGLDKPWFGNIWMNPPYLVGLVDKFTERLAETRGDYKQAIVLVNNATETKWFASLIGIASALVFPTSRIKFYIPGKETRTPLQGQAIIYIGDNADKFLDVFSRFGWGANVWKK